MTALAAIFIGGAFIVSCVALLFAVVALDTTRDNSKHIARNDVELHRLRDIDNVADEVYARLKNDKVI